MRVGLSGNIEWSLEGVVGKKAKGEAWLEAKRRYRLSEMQVKMGQELGLNPFKLGKIANHKQEPWKAPLGVFIESLYEERFGGVK